MIAAMADLAQSLAGIPLFAGLGKKDLKRLAKQMSEHTFSEGDAIATEGQSGVGFFLIEEGSAQVSIDGEVDPHPRAGRPVRGDRPDRRGPALGDGRRGDRHALPRDELLGVPPFVQQHPELAWPLLQALARYLRDAGARETSPGN